MFKAVLLLLFVTLIASEELPQVLTGLGVYKGHYVNTLGGRRISAFNGIRYAKTPKRFEEAVKVEAHSDVYSATKDGEDCVQISHNYNQYPFEESLGKKMVGSEDCLFLNVYTPKVKPEKPLPVMVWIHGGGFAIGTGASNWHGPEILLDKDVVLVTLNYRLAIFGFLSFDNDVLPGNLGLKDQALALLWVKENIAAFGGDPNSITIFGESAGGASVHLQMHSPRSKGLFHRAISQSGSLDCPWSIMPKTEAKATALRVASFLKCQTEPTNFLKCLQEKTAEELMDAALSLKKMKVALEINFAPVIENKVGGFITENDLSKRSTIPWLGGVNSGEGLIFYVEIAMVGDKNLSNFNKNYKMILPGLFKYATHPEAEKITKLIKKNYIGDKDFSEETLKQFINMLSDGLFIKGQLESVKKHQGNSYLYLLTHNGEKTIVPFGSSALTGYGVSHGDDLFYLFPMKKTHPKLEFNAEDTKVLNLILDLWTNFAINGTPTPEKVQPQWYESENGKLYVTISSNGIEMAKHLYSTRMNFWDNLPTNMHQQHDKDEL